MNGQFCMQTDILIVGGGAGGLAAAINAKRASARLNVVLAEAQPRTGKKLLATGNGRCNIMNAEAAPERYASDAHFIAPALDYYKAEHEAFWHEAGVPLMLEDEGRVYPRANQSNAVLDALRLRLRELGAVETIGFECARLQKTKVGFKAVSSAGDEILCRRLILATGGRAGKGLGENESFIKLLSPFGHTFSPTYPALTYFKTDRRLISGLKGVRMKGEVSLYNGGVHLQSEKGEILFRDEGVSGIAVMQLSLKAAPLIARDTHLSLMLRPLEDANELGRRMSLYKSRPVRELFTGCLNRMLALNLIKLAGIAPEKKACELTQAEALKLNALLTSWQLPVTGTGGYSEAQVMLGGARTNEFCAESLESRIVPGLYAAGEMLDVTGPCGGYNLEWAWASGMLAGRKAAESL